MSTVLVTGVAGFIGARTAGLLLAGGTRVVGVDNLNDYYDVRLKQHRLDRLAAQAGFEFQRGDVENRDFLQRLFSAHHFETVYNLAARAGVRYSMVDPHVYMSTNAQGTLNLLEAMRQAGTPKLVLASTSSLYAGQPLPFSEDLPVNEPISPYAASKKAAEVMAYAYHHLYGLDVSVVRYFTVYGPAGRPDMSIFRFIKWIDEGKPVIVYGDGSQSRDFTYVDDIARGTVAAAKMLGYEIINLGGGRKPRSLLYLIEAIEKLLGNKAKLERRPEHAADMRETWADIGKAGRLLGWSPETGIEEGLEKTVRWHLDEREWLKDITV
jgi:UDP-glucuronate 4-epimerase